LVSACHRRCVASSRSASRARKAESIAVPAVDALDAAQEAGQPRWSIARRAGMHGLPTVVPRTHVLDRVAHLGGCHAGLRRQLPKRCFPRGWADIIASAAGAARALLKYAKPNEARQPR